MSNEKSLEPRPLDWSLLKNEGNASLLQHTVSLVKLRTSTPAMNTDNFEITLIDAERQILGYKRWNDTGGVALIVANLRDKPAGVFTIADKGLEDGIWREHVNNFETTVQAGVLTDTLGPSEVKIYLKQ